MVHQYLLFILPVISNNFDFCQKNRLQFKQNRSYSARKTQYTLYISRKDQSEHKINYVGTCCKDYAKFDDQCSHPSIGHATLLECAMVMVWWQSSLVPKKPKI